MISTELTRILDIRHCTRFCATKESLGGDEAKKRLLESGETGTVHTRVFDIAQEIPWPEVSLGCALRNDFTKRWHGREDELSENLSAARENLREARGKDNFSENHIYAGQSVGMVSDVPSAGDLVERSPSGAEGYLRFSASSLD